MLALLAALAVIVSDAPTPTPPSHATGTWGGARSWLEAQGLELELDYTSEVFALAAGGNRAGETAYRGTLDLWLELDTAPALWPGGTLFFLAQEGHGDTGISGAAGAGEPVSNLEAEPFFQVSELWYQQSVLDGRLGLKLGKQDGNRDFAAPRFPGNFVHSSFGLLPTMRLPTFPADDLGAVLFVDPVPALSLRAGVFDGSPEVVILAVIARQDLGDAQPEGALYQLGGWADPDGNHGGFAIADVLFRLDGKHSLQAFLRGGWNPADGHPANLYAGGGVTYHGVRGGRDTVGLGQSLSHFPGDAMTPEHTEGDLEVFYKARLAPWFTVEPDLQVVLGPGGEQGAALVTGLRVKLKL